MILFLPRLIRWGFRLMMLAFGAALVYLGVVAYQVYRAAHTDQAAPAQAIIVMGAAEYNGTPSPDLAARLDHAYELWKRGYASVVVVTGGGQPGDVFTEADAGRGYLEAKGVPDSDILADNQGNNSWESLSGAAGALAPRRLTRVILVSDPFHDLRIQEMASDLGLSGLVSPTLTSPIRGAAVVPYYAKETLAVGLGRLIGYRRLSGFSRSLGLVRMPAGGG